MLKTFEGKILQAKMGTNMFLKCAQISFVFIVLNLITSFAVYAQDQVANEIMADSIVIGKAYECAPAAKKTDVFGNKVGEALAGYYIKKYPRYDRYKMSEAISSGLHIGAEEQYAQGGNTCPQVIKKANGLLKKYGSGLRY